MHNYISSLIKSKCLLQEGEIEYIHLSDEAQSHQVLHHIQLDQHMLRKLFACF